MGYGLVVEDRDLGGGWVEAYYFELRTFAAMAIQHGVRPERRRLWQLAAEGLGRVPAEALSLGKHPFKTGGFFFLSPRGASEADALAVRAVAEVLREMEPGWVAAVEEAPRLANSPDVVAAWAGVPVEAVLAALGGRGGPFPEPGPSNGR